MTNIKIRYAMLENNLTQWKLAELLGVCEMTVHRKLRSELPEEEQDRIVSIIERSKKND